MIEDGAHVRYLLVQLEAMPVWRANGLVLAIKQHPGVTLVCDLSAVSADTLEVLLMPKVSPPVVDVPLQAALFGSD